MTTVTATATRTAARTAPTCPELSQLRPPAVPFRGREDMPNGGIAPRREQSPAIAQAAESDRTLYTVPEEPKWETDLTEEERADKIIKTHGAAALIKLWGYPCEIHEVTTSDGTRLTLQRIPDRRHGRTRGAEMFAPCPLPGVILWHGLGISADVWVCNLEQESNLALVLAEEGYDVWLANSRGNHHTTADPTTVDIDQIAYMDIPAVVDFILKMTRRETLSYLGYSQGTTSVFASLSLHEDLNRKINVVIALAPALKPKPETITSSVLRGILRLMGPDSLYVILGKGAFLSRAPTFRKYAPAALYACTTSTSFSALFNWRCERLGSYRRKVALFNHCFGGTSVRNLVHWFQIMSDGPFHTSLHHYWNGIHGTSLFSNPFNYTDISHPVNYPTKHITAKMHLFYGSEDSITDRDHLVDHLPSSTELHEIEGYTHLDFL
ncbi:hypothetical protein HK101_005653, partial [Irineochytrium annulatum]